MTDIIELEVNGSLYTNFDNISVEKSVWNPGGRFSFSTSASLKDFFPIKPGDSCAVKVNGNYVITGFIDEVAASYSSSSHGITISGRDATADLIDSSVGPDFELKGPITLLALINQTIQHMKLPLVAYTEPSLEDLEPISESELASAEFDVKGWEFLSKFASLRQVLLISDGTGGIYITRGNDKGDAPLIQNAVGGIGNNVKSAEYRDNWKDRYHTYGFTGQLSPTVLFDQSDSAEAIEQTNTAIAGQSGLVTDDQIRETRRLFMKPEESSDSTSLEDRARWQANINKAKGRQYSATLSGFSRSENSIWEPNQPVYVVDNFAKINERMLITAVAYKYGIGSGSEVTLECVQSDLLSLEATKPPKESK